jgi:hypothetical protein
MVQLDKALEKLSVNFESLSGILKNQIRREIILILSEKVSVSYVDLMKLVGITNTGRLNYHLKILGDLIKKDESGKYSLTNKGQLAVQFLQKSVGKETEQTSLPINTRTFVTRAFNIAQGLLWLMFSIPFVTILFQWYLYFFDPSYYIGDPAIPLMIATLPVGAGFVLFGMAAFPKIEVDRDSAEVRYAFVRLFFGLDEIEIDPKRHILRLGEFPMTNWFVPFKERECFDFLGKRVGGYKARPLFLIYLLLFPVLDLSFNLGRNIYGSLAPIYWALVWGVATALSMTFFAYAAPASMRIGNLLRGASAIIFGVSIGIVIYFLMFVGLQIH